MTSWSGGRAPALVLVTALVASACGAREAGPPPGDARGGPGSTYPGVLHPPSELTPDLVVEQHVEAKRGDKGGGFDAVLQKRGGDLLLVGLGPMGMRAFVLRQEGDDASVEQSIGPKLPFPPRNVLVDIHRAFFKRLPSPPQDGTHRGRLDDEEVVEVWRGGALVERSFAREDQRGVVRVLYGPGCAAGRCEPATIRLVNEWFGYELIIENRRFHPVP